MIYLENMCFFNIFFITVKKTLILDDFGFFDVIFLFFMGVYREIAYYSRLIYLLLSRLPLNGLLPLKVSSAEFVFCNLFVLYVIFNR